MGENGTFEINRSFPTQENIEYTQITITNPQYRTNCIPRSTTLGIRVSTFPANDGINKQGLEIQIFGETYRLINNP